MRSLKRVKRANAIGDSASNACGSRLTFPNRARETDAIETPPTAILFFFFSLQQLQWLVRLIRATDRRAPRKVSVSTRCDRTCTSGVQARCVDGAAPSAKRLSRDHIIMTNATALDPNSQVNGLMQDPCAWVSPEQMQMCQSTAQSCHAILKFGLRRIYGLVQAAWTLCWGSHGGCKSTAGQHAKAGSAHHAG